jgi:hypothetical protein
VLIVAIVPDIMQADADQLVLNGSLENAGVKRPLEHFREQGQNINMHRLILP